MEALGNLNRISPSPPSRGTKKAENVPAPTRVVSSREMADAYIELLGDQDAEVRLAALRGLGVIVAQLPHEPPPAALIAALGDSSAPIRAADIEAVAGFHEKLDSFIPQIARGLGPDEPVKVRSASVQALSKLHPSAISAASVPALVSIFDHGDRDLRFQVIKLLPGSTAMHVWPQSRPSSRP